MRGLKKCIQWQKKNHTNKHTDQKTDGHCDSLTESAQWGNREVMLLKHPTYGRHCISQHVRIAKRNQ